MSFADRYGPWALVAGASEGTGREFARRIAASGVPCILVARRAEPLAALADEIRAESGVECVTATIDLAAPDALDRIVAAAAEREVGLFISNAGGDPNGSRFLDRDVTVWLELTQRNVVTTIECCHHFAGLMKGRGRGGCCSSIPALAMAERASWPPMRRARLSCSASEKRCGRSCDLTASTCST